jgi:hypothetical protein
MKLLLLSLIPIGLSAQTIADVQNIATLAQTQLTVLQSVTGTDGTLCNLYKVPSSTINAYFACALGNQNIKTAQLLNSGTTKGNWILSQGTQLWIIGSNPTSSSVSFGSVGNAPAAGITWNAIAGAGAGVVSGTVTWP